MYDLHILHSFRSDIVIVQLGTNDLPSCPPLLVGSALEDLVHLLHDSYGVKGLWVSQTIRRRANVVFNQSRYFNTMCPGGLGAYPLSHILGPKGLLEGPQ